MANGIDAARGAGEGDFDASARRILHSWRSQTKALSEAHHEAQVYFKQMSACLTISSLVAGAFTTSTGLFSGGTSAALSESVDWHWNIVLGCMGIASTLFVAIDGVFTPGILQASHRECEKAYNKLTREITVQLLADPSSGRTDMMFSSLWMCLAHFREKLDDLEDQSPPIPTAIRKRLVAGKGARRESVTSAPSDTGVPTPESSLSPVSHIPGLSHLPHLGPSPSRRLRVSFDIANEGCRSPGALPIVIVPREES